MQLDLFEEVSIFVVLLGRFGTFAKLLDWGVAIWHIAPLRFAPAISALAEREHRWLRYNNISYKIWHAFSAKWIQTSANQFAA